MGKTYGKANSTFLCFRQTRWWLMSIFSMLKCRIPQNFQQVACLVAPLLVGKDTTLPCKVPSHLILLSLLGTSPSLLCRKQISALPDQYCRSCAHEKTTKQPMCAGSSMHHIIWMFHPHMCLFQTYECHKLSAPTKKKANFVHSNSNTSSNISQQILQIPQRG